MTRSQLQALAEERLADAAALLAANRWAAAYYLAGYAVECALKAVLLRHLGESDAVFRDRESFKKLAAECYTHDLAVLVRHAGLETDFGRDRGADSALDSNWTTAKDWKETSRYLRKGEAEARSLVGAISDPEHGVMRWVRTRW